MKQADRTIRVEWRCGEEANAMRFGANRQSPIGRKKTARAPPPTRLRYSEEFQVRGEAAVIAGTPHTPRECGRRRQRRGHWNGMEGLRLETLELGFRPIFKRHRADLAWLAKSFNSRPPLARTRGACFEFRTEMNKKRRRNCEIQTRFTNCEI